MGPSWFVGFEIYGCFSFQVLISILLDGIASFICQFKMENRKDTTLIYAKLELSNYLLNIELLRNLVVLQLIKHRGVQQQRQGTRVTSTGDTIRERTVAVLYVYFIQLFLEKCNYFIYILISLFSVFVLSNFFL